MTYECIKPISITLPKLEDMCEAEKLLSLKDFIKARREKTAELLEAIGEKNAYEERERKLDAQVAQRGGRRTNNQAMDIIIGQSRRIDEIQDAIKAADAKNDAFNEVVSIGNTWLACFLELNRSLFGFSMGKGKSYNGQEIDEPEIDIPNMAIALDKARKLVIQTEKRPYLFGEFDSSLEWSFEIHPTEKDSQVKPIVLERKVGYDWKNRTAKAIVPPIVTVIDAVAKNREAFNFFERILVLD